MYFFRIENGLLVTSSQELRMGSTGPSEFGQNVVDFRFPYVFDVRSLLSHIKRHSWWTRMSRLAPEKIQNCINPCSLR